MYGLIFLIFIYNAKVRQLLRSAGRQITDYTTLFTDSLSAYLLLLLDFNISSGEWKELEDAVAAIPVVGDRYNAEQQKQVGR